MKTVWFWFLIYYEVSFAADEIKNFIGYILSEWLDSNIKIKKKTITKNFNESEIFGVHYKET